MHLDYYENGAELLSKLAITNGYGYDLLIADDHTLEVLIAQGMLASIDHEKLSIWDDLNPVLAHPYYDSEYRYSVPYYWGIYGIGYDANTFANGLPSRSWGLIFSNALCADIRICMSDDPREAILLAAYYLFGSLDALKNRSAQEAVKQLLIKQKKQVEVYSLARAGALLQTKSCALAMIASPDAARLARIDSSIQFVIPPEGSFLVMDCFALPRNGAHTELVYDFLRFILSPESLEHHSRLYGFCPPLQGVASAEQQPCPAALTKKLEFFREVISDQRINELWIEVLAA